jgi:transcriptional regulator with XRE-family HTH domain
MSQMDATTQRRIADQVHAERKRRRLSQKELAGMAGVSTNTIGNMERGTSFPQRSHLVTICGLLGISLDEGHPMGDEDERPIVEDGGWSPDVRVALNVIGLYLESFSPTDREEHIATIVRAIMARRL